MDRKIRRYEVAFETLKNKLCETPILRYPYIDFKEQFTLTSDTSNEGIGTVFSQDNHSCYYISKHIK